MRSKLVDILWLLTTIVVFCVVTVAGMLFISYLYFY